MKRILDSVHGYITIPKKICSHIIDTVYFQRLRRIEQTSIRSVFPCARHDRFTHSLGVYHIGRKIISSIKDRYGIDAFEGRVRNEKVFESYELACLLHDVCHSPFSHTFEDKYSIETNLEEMLMRELSIDKFSDDLSNQFSKAASHEIMSALMVIREYKTFITTQTKADVELIVRMIIGCKYTDPTNSFENAFIDLIHGEIIDADRIDYVCRDVWASGYATSLMDVDRLIDSIHIEKNQNKYVVCYSTKSFNEIESLFNVKAFQQNNIFTHHTIIYEQHLLVKAIESAAVFHVFGMTNCEDQKQREVAIQKLCNINSFYSTITLENTKRNLIYPTDDDFISLMKDIPSDKYVSAWFTRKYEHIPLWKSMVEFYHYFPILQGKKFSDKCWLFSECHAGEFIAKKIGVNRKDIWILLASPKYTSKYQYKENMHIYIKKDEIKLYYDLFDKKIEQIPYDVKENPFAYIYIPKAKENQKLDIIKCLVEEVEKFIYN